MSDHGSSHGKVEQGGAGHSHDHDKYHMAKHQAQHRLMEKTTFKTTERLIERASERVVERAGERMLERAGTNVMQRSAERVTRRAMKRASSRLAQRTSKRVATRIAQRLVGEAFRVSEALHPFNFGLFSWRAEECAAKHAGKQAAQGGGKWTMDAMKALQVMVPAIGLLFVAHMAHQDWHRVTKEWQQGRNILTTGLFVAAAICDTADVAVHLLVVSSLTVVNVDHHVVHSIEHYGLIIAVIATICMIIGEILSARSNSFLPGVSSESELCKHSTTVVPCTDVEASEDQMGA